MDDSATSVSSIISSVSDKRVTFQDDLQVFPFERLDESYNSELFYDKDDFRRFKAETVRENREPQLQLSKADKAKAKRMAMAQKLVSKRRGLV